MYFLFSFSWHVNLPSHGHFGTGSSGSNRCPLGLECTLLTCVHSLKFNEEVPLFKGSNKRVMCLTCVSLVLVFFFPPGLSAYRRGLAKDPDGQISCHKPPWRHEDLAEVCQPLWKERTPGQYIDSIVKKKAFSVFWSDLVVQIYLEEYIQRWLNQAHQMEKGTLTQSSATPNSSHEV